MQELVPSALRRSIARRTLREVREMGDIEIAEADGFLMKEPAPLIDPDGVTNPTCLIAAGWKSRLRSAGGQAGEALAVITSIVAIGLVYVVL